MAVRDAGLEGLAALQALQHQSAAAGGGRMDNLAGRARLIGERERGTPRRSAFLDQRLP
jgi:hypothetical protein